MIRLAHFGDPCIFCDAGHDDVESGACPKAEANPYPAFARRLALIAAELAAAQQWVQDLQSGMYINCVYCGHRYGPSDEVPAAMADVLKKHVEQCPRHPMSALKAQLATLRALAESVVSSHDADASEYEDPAADLKALSDGLYDAALLEVIHGDMLHEAGESHEAEAERADAAEASAYAPNIQWYKGKQLVGQVTRQSSPDGMHWAFKAMIERVGGNHEDGRAEKMQDAIARVEEVLTKTFPHSGRTTPYVVEKRGVL